MATEDAPDVPKGDDLPAEDKLREAANQAQKALEAQGMANKLRDAASSVTDPKKRAKYMQDAYDKEVEAHGNSRKARLLRSGAFQGGVGGAGIGAAVGAGLGTVVGTVVGTATAIPTTALGGLVGSGVGAFHGPWHKLGGGLMSKKKGAKEGEAESKDGEKVNKSAEESLKEIEENDDMVPDPEALRQQADAIAEQREREETSSNGGSSTGRKKPRKIEIRSKPSGPEDD